VFSRWTFAIYSSVLLELFLSRALNLPAAVAGELFRSLRGIDRLTILRAIAPIRFPKKNNDDVRVYSYRRRQRHRRAGSRAGQDRAPSLGPEATDVREIAMGSADDSVVHLPG
jgi:hypothetical protein